MSGTVRTSELAIAIEEELQGYAEEVEEEIREAVRQVAKECVKEIKEAAPVKTGEYKRGWKSKVAYDGPGALRIQVYNNKKPQLTHLREFGHAKRKGGRVEGKPHIYPAEKAAKKKLENRARVSLQRR